MTPEYVSIDPSSTPDEGYTRIKKPELNYEYVNADVPVNDDYLTPNPFYTRANGVNTGDRP